MWKNKLTNDVFSKNYHRTAPSFANINLLGKCNADCFFCLGTDIDPILSLQNQTRLHFNEWENFSEFLTLCKDNSVNNIYVTGQNTDALIYKHLDELVDMLQSQSFDVGLRTNGYLSKSKMSIMQKCRRSVGFSIHTLNPETSLKIMGKSRIPDWDTIIPMIPNVRISIVVNRYNEDEVFDLFKYAAGFDNVKYVQIRRICTDSREEYLLPDVEAFERVADKIAQCNDKVGEFYGAPLYKMYGKEFCVWRTVETDIDSYNYFTDGTICDKYFVIEGFMKDSVNYPKIDDIPVDPHGKGLEGFWK